MYTLSEQQIDHILNDIKLRGVEMEDLQLNLLDHICCIIESELDRGEDFQSLYQKTIPKFFKKELREIEDETQLLLTFKNYYAMKKTMIVSGTVSVAAFIFGSFLKIMHWPGAGPMLVLGISISSLIFLPLLAILKNREIKVKQDKLVLFIGTLVGILYSNFVLFKVMHWPGANILLFSFISLAFFVFLPVYFFTGIRNPETKVNTITSSILLMMVIGLQFTLVNVRPTRNLLQIKMYTYLKDEELLKRFESKVSSSDPKVAHINTQCEQLKGMILNTFLDQTTIPKDFEAQGILMEEGNLGQEFSDNGPGIQLLKELKTEITDYNNSVTAENKIPLEHSILDIAFPMIFSYSNYTVLNSIDQLQLYLANAKMN